MRCRFVTSAATVVGGADVLVVASVVVAVASRSFFRKRNRDVSSTSTVTAVGAADFFGLAADGALTNGGDICSAFISFESTAFVSFGVVSVDVGDGDDSVDDGVVIIIVGFSLMVGTICNELPNFTLFSANGFDNVLNERNSVLSAPDVSFVQAGSMRRPVLNELVKMFGLLVAVLLVLAPSGTSILIWNGDVNALVTQSNCRMFGGSVATIFVRTSDGRRYD